MDLTYTSVALGLAIAVACAWYCRRLAAEKGYNVVLWAILGFVLTVIAVPVLVLLPPRGVNGLEGEPSSGRDGDEDPSARDGAGAGA